MSGWLSDAWSWLVALPPLARIALGVGALLLALLLAAAIRVAWAARRLHNASQPGRRASRVQPGQAIPPTNYARNGLPSDPLNIRVIGTADQLAASFVAAGWYRADELTLLTSIRIVLDALLARSYSTAPVSDLYLFGHRQDFAFEKPGHSVRERDHVRFWKVAERHLDGRPLWVGGATRDSRVELAKTNHLPTHGIEPDVDAERELVVSDLIGSGWVISESFVQAFPGPTHTTNATGDPYFTDGQAAILTLALTQPVPLAPQFVRRGAAPLARRVARWLRPLLPQRGRELAHRWEATRRERQHARPPDQPSV
jgi:LssY-like putative type I secretion system component LssY